MLKNKTPSTDHELPFHCKKKCSALKHIILFVTHEHFLNTIKCSEHHMLKSGAPNVQKLNILMFESYSNVLICDTKCSNKLEAQIMYARYSNYEC